MRAYWILGITVVFILTLIGGTYFFGMFNNNEEIKKIQLTEKLSETSEVEDDTIKIAVSALISPKTTLSVYNDIFEYISKRLGKRIELVQRKTYAEVNDLIEKQEVDAGFICSGPYVTGHADFGLELLAAPEMYGTTTYYSYLIVHKDSTAKSMSDLYGKRFAFTDPNSNSGKLAPTYILYQMGETPESFFNDYTFSGGHDNSIEMVAKQIVDGAAIDHLIYKYFQRNKLSFVENVKVIAKYGPYGIPPVVVHPKIDPNLKSQLKSILLSMHEDPEGKKLLNSILIDKFVEVDDSLYNSVREIESSVGLD